MSDGDHAFRQAEAARKCGFRLGGGLNPAVVEPQNRGFTPSEEDVRDAHWVLEQYRQLAGSGETGARSMAASSIAMRPPGLAIRWNGPSCVPSVIVKRPRRSPVCKRPCRKHLPNLVEIGESCLFGARI